MSTQESTAPQSALLASQQSPTVGEYVRNYLRRVRSGDLGSIPIVFGLLVIAIIFQSQNENFLTARNFVNLILQMAGITAIAYGVVYVLLLGEIDLSIGYVSAVAGVGMTLLLRIPGGDPETWPWYAFSAEGWPWWLAIITALIAVAVIGYLHGLIVTTFQVPSFVVTLAGLLAWNGVVLYIIGGGGTVIIQDKTVINIANYFLPQLWGWIVGGIGVLIFAGSQLQRLISRRRRGLSRSPFQLSSCRLFSWQPLPLWLSISVIWIEACLLWALSCLSS